MENEKKKKIERVKKQQTDKYVVIHETVFQILIYVNYNFTIGLIFYADNFVEHFEFSFGLRYFFYFDR